MSDLNEMYEDLTTRIGNRMPPLVASLIPGAISRTVEGINESPVQVAEKGQETVTNSSQCSVFDRDCEVGGELLNPCT